jgi:hypothetical protein
MKHIIGALLCAIALTADSDDFYLKDKAGRETGPYRLGDGATVKVGGAEATISFQTADAKGVQAEVDHLDRIRLPEVDFREATVTDVAGALEKLALQHDPEKRGARIRLRPANADGASTNRVAVPVTFRAHDISVLEVVRIVANLADLKYRLEDDALVLLPRDVPEGPIVTRLFDVLPNLAEKADALSRELGESGEATNGRKGGSSPSDGPAGDRDWKAFFKELGVNWPAGSSIRYLPAIGKLAVANTVENLEILETRLAASDVVPCQIELELQYVAFKLADLSRIAAGGIRQSELDELRARGAGRLMAAPKLITQSGIEAVVKGDSEWIYPTEFAVTGIAGTNVTSKPPAIAEPGNFETREVGAIVRALPEVSCEGQMINVTLSTEYVQEPLWRDYGHSWTGSDGVTNCVPMEQPIFHVFSANTTLAVASGGTVLAGGGMPSRDGQECVYCYLTVRLVDPCGKDIATASDRGNAPSVRP